jgi:hypothetical protein
MQRALNVCSGEPDETPDNDVNLHLGILGSGLFNSSLDGKARRDIDIHEGDKVDETALKDLIRAAVALNLKGRSLPLLGYC